MGMCVEGERQCDGIEDTHPGILAHPRFADRRQPPGKLRKAPRYREGDLVFGKDIFRCKRTPQPDSRDATGQDTSFPGHLKDALDQPLTSLTAP